MDRKQKIILVTAGVVIVIGIGLFWFFRNNNETPSSGPGNFPESGGTTTNTVQDYMFDDESGVALRLITQHPVASAAVGGAGNKLLYHLRSNGQLYGNSFTGGEEAIITDINIPVTIDADFSPTVNMNLLTYVENGERARYFVVDYSGATPRGSRLEESFFSAALAPHNKSLAYITRNGNESVLVVSDLVFVGEKLFLENTRALFRTHLTDLDIFWISESSIAIKTKTSVFAPSILWIVPLQGEERVLLAPTTGLDVQFSRDGNRFLYSNSSPRNPLSLWYTDTQTPQNISAFPSPTLPEKCVWSNKDNNVLFCAIPKSLPTNTLPDAWWTGEVFFNDNIWRINLKTGDKNLLWDQNDFDAIKLFSSPNDDYLFFINKKDSSLWSLELKKS